MHYWSIICSFHREHYILNQKVTPFPDALIMCWNLLYLNFCPMCLKSDHLGQVSKVRFLSGLHPRCLFSMFLSGLCKQEGCWGLRLSVFPWSSCRKRLWEPHPSHNAPLKPMAGMCPLRHVCSDKLAFIHRDTYGLKHTQDQTVTVRAY